MLTEWKGFTLNPSEHVGTVSPLCQSFPHPFHILTDLVPGSASRPLRGIVNWEPD